MDNLAEFALLRVVEFAADSLSHFSAVATLSPVWHTVAFDVELRPMRQRLARKLCLPRVADQSLLSNSALMCEGEFKKEFDWLAFCARQIHLQSIFAGQYGGELSPENLPDDINSDIFDWEEQHTVSAKLDPLDIKRNRCGTACRNTYADEEELANWCGEYEWLVLDRRRAFDEMLWNCLMIFHGSSPQQPAEQWEDGNLLCGVRGPFDFRPAVDPDFLDLTSMIVLLIPYPGACDHWLAWVPRLYAPCAWMLPKQTIGQKRQAEKLDLWASFRDERTVAALVLGRHLEKPITYDAIETMVEFGQRTSSDIAADPRQGRISCAPQAASSSRRKGGRRSKAHAEPRDYRSGKNPTGLNLFVPRPRTASDNASSRGRARTGSNDSADKLARNSILTCSISAESFFTFLKEKKPSLQQAEQLCVYAGDTSYREIDYDSLGLLEDAARLEKIRALSKASIIDLARKWKCLGGKWLLFVPVWHVDTLFQLAAYRLREGSFDGCTRLIVSPPGAFGTDTDKFMLSLHCNDFTNEHQVMSAGKTLRAAARQGLRTPSGTWGELRDDPFAPKEKKAVLVFKPEVFTCLSLHRNNPYGIKTTLFTIDL